MSETYEPDPKNLTLKADEKHFSAQDSALDGDAKATSERDVEKDFEKQRDSADEDRVEVTPQAEQSDPNIVDFDGPDDLENPLNWSKSKKWANGGLLSAFTLITYVFQLSTITGCHKRD